MAEYIGYKTKQKEVILNCLKANSSKNMTADEIYLEILKAGTKIGIATIYRNLAILVKEEKIKKFNVDNVSSYQYLENVENCKSHYHLQCINCNKIYHVDLPELDKLAEKIADGSDFYVDNQKVILYGKCKNCLSY